MRGEKKTFLRVLEDLLRIFVNGNWKKLKSSQN